MEINTVRSMNYRAEKRTAGLNPPFPPKKEKEKKDGIFYANAMPSSDTSWGVLEKRQINHLPQAAGGKVLAAVY